MTLGAERRYFIFLVCFMVANLVSGKATTPERPGQHPDDLFSSIVSKRSADTLIATTMMASDSCLHNSVFFRTTMQSLVNAEIRRLERCMTDETT